MSDMVSATVAVEVAENATPAEVIGAAVRAVVDEFGPGARMRHDADVIVIARRPMPGGRVELAIRGLVGVDR